MIYISKPIANLGTKNDQFCQIFLNKKMKEKKTLMKRSRSKGHKKIEELRHQASHISMTEFVCSPLRYINAYIIQ
jgi:hypothetical protein